MNDDLLPVGLGVLTDPGLAHDTNEDSLKTYQADHNARHGGRLFIVADGLGGAQYGKLASQMAVDRTGSAFYETMREDPTLLPVQALRLAIQQTNTIIYNQAVSLGMVEKMATTVVAALLRGNQLTIAWVGDSRAYLIQGDIGTIQPLTRDHKVVAEQVRQGLLTEEEARHHPHRNTLSRSLGGRPQVRVDVVVGEVQAGDIVVLCTDGLTRYVTDDEILSHARSGGDWDAIARDLVALAKERGGRDNLSVMLLYLNHPTVLSQPVRPVVPAAPVQPPAPRPAQSVRSRSRRGIPLVAVLGVIVLAGGGALLAAGVFKPGSGQPVTPSAAITMESPTTPSAAEAVRSNLQTPDMEALSRTAPASPPPTATATVTPIPPPTATPLPTATPTLTATIDPNAPQPWAVGDRLYITERTSVYPSAGGGDPSFEYEPGTVVVILRRGNSTVGDYQFRVGEQWWWHVGRDDGGAVMYPGWVPESALSATPPPGFE